MARAEPLQPRHACAEQAYAHIFPCALVSGQLDPAAAFVASSNQISFVAKPHMPHCFLCQAAYAAYVALVAREQCCGAAEVSAARH